MIKHSGKIYVLALGLCVVVGCPSIFARSSDNRTETRERTTVDAKSGDVAANDGGAAGVGGGQLGLSGSEALELARLDEPLQPAPPEETLCMLQIGVTLIGDVKRILGEPRTESQANEGATLSYLFANGQSLFLTFGSLPTRDEDVTNPSAWQYVFAQAEVTRIAYPGCWRRSLLP